MKKLMLCVIGALLVAGVIVMRRPKVEPFDRVKAEDDIREAIFRHQLHEVASRDSGISAYAAYFLSAGENHLELSDEFIRRFADHRPPVKKASQAIVSAESAKDKETGQDGMLLSACDIKWIDDANVEVFGGWFISGLAMSGNTYRLKRENGGWIVIEDKLLFLASVVHHSQSLPALENQCM